MKSRFPQKYGALPENLQVARSWHDHEALKRWNKSQTWLEAEYSEEIGRNTIISLVAKQGLQALQKAIIIEISCLC